LGLKKVFKTARKGQVSGFWEYMNGQEQLPLIADNRVEAKKIFKAFSPDTRVSAFKTEISETFSSV